MADSGNERLQAERRLLLDRLHRLVGLPESQLVMLAIGYLAFRLDRMGASNGRAAWDQRMPTSVAEDAWTALIGALALGPLSEAASVTGTAHFVKVNQVGQPRAIEHLSASLGKQLRLDQATIIVGALSLLDNDVALARMDRALAKLRDRPADWAAYQAERESNEFAIATPAAHP